MDATSPDGAPGATPFPYEGPPALQQRIVDALTGVVDPEIGLSIVDVGLVYGVRVLDDIAEVRLTMTSAACPLAELILDEAADALERVLPADCVLDLQLVWEPPWTPALMSARGRHLMGW